MIEPGTTQGGIPFQLEDSNGNIIDPAREGFNIPTYDYILVTYTDATQDFLSTAVFKRGGSGGTTVATITVAYPTATTVTYTKT